MSAKDSPLVEYAPWILKALGILLILADGPLPFMDPLGYALIAYGSALGASYKLADAAIAVEAHFDSSPSAMSDRAMIPHTPTRIGPPGKAATPGPHFSRRWLPDRKHGWCVRHRRHDLCRSRY